MLCLSVCVTSPSVPSQSVFLFPQCNIYFSFTFSHSRSLPLLVSSRWGDSFINELRAEVINCGMSDRDAISSAGSTLTAVVLQAGRRSRTGSDTVGVCQQPAITQRPSHLQAPCTAVSSSSLLMPAVGDKLSCFYISKHFTAKTEMAEADIEIA